MCVPSQAYAYTLVRQALAKNAVVVPMRNTKRWELAIPELIGFENRFELKNHRAGAISQRNCPQGYNRIVDILKLKMQEDS